MKEEPVTSEQRVKQVWPDAWEGGMGFIWANAYVGDQSLLGSSWHDAASRLPEPQQAERGYPGVAARFKADFGVAHPRPMRKSAPSPQPTEQTFEEWWATYCESYEADFGEIVIARAAWNAAKGGR